MTRALRILRIERSVTDLNRAVAFYVGALGFEAVLGAVGATEIAVRRGGQILVLQGGGVPEHVSACDQAFQHIALPVTDMGSAFARLRQFAPRMITEGGPVLLPPSSGGVTAVKFCDPDGHPVELLQFPDQRSGGIDHSAMVVTDVQRSIAFYQNTLGLRVTARQINQGPEQDRLDGFAGVSVDVVAMAPGAAPPHVELLAYSFPFVHPGRAATSSATRLVFEIDPANSLEHLQDLDGHGMTFV